ncbi:MAG: response regulator transcription factor [Geminicoccaceae bacterium]|nr:response regulator transcription factor [Geminicoccaceae bacterium]
MRILVVEDERRIREALSASLAEQGYIVETAIEGEDGWFKGDSEDFDAVVLDLGLPVLDGLSVLRRWRAAGRSMPVLILTARGSWSEKVEGIDAGADDYLAKPFQMAELLARLRALIRRSKGLASPTIEIGGVRIDAGAARVQVLGRPVELSALEFRLLSYLMHNAGRVVSRMELTEHIYDQDFERDSNTIEVLMGRLRRKLGVPLVRTRRGLGYVIDRPLSG